MDSQAQSNVQMRCPICGHPVTKKKESDRDIKHNVCANEFYIHYVDVHGDHVLQKFSEDKIEATEKRFQN